MPILTQLSLWTINEASTMYWMFCWFIYFIRIFSQAQQKRSLDIFKQAARYLHIYCPYIALFSIIIEGFFFIRTLSHRMQFLRVCLGGKKQKSVNFHILSSLLSGIVFRFVLHSNAFVIAKLLIHNIWTSQLSVYTRGPGGIFRFIYLNYFVWF